MTRQSSQHGDEGGEECTCFGSREKRQFRRGGEDIVGGRTAALRYFM